MLKAVRVRKHPDHGHGTWFRLFLDDELDCSFPVSDKAADEVEYRLLGMGYAARIEALERDAKIQAMEFKSWIKDLTQTAEIHRLRAEALETALRPFAEILDHIADVRSIDASLVALWLSLTDLENARAALREPGAGEEEE